MSRTRSREGAEPLAGETLLQEGSRWLLKSTDRDASGATGLVPALDKAMKIIAFLNEPRGGEPALPEIVEATGVTRSHCHAILKTLVAHGWLAFDTRAKTYRLSPGVLKYVSSVLNETHDLDVIRPILQDLAQRVQVPFMVARPLADGSFIVVDKFSAQHVLEISFPVGYRFPHDACAHMRANLAWLPEAKLDACLEDLQPTRYTDMSIVEDVELREELTATRRRGYARSVGEFTEGLMAIAKPVFGRDGRVIYIISSSSLVPIMLDKEEEVASAMNEAVSKIHRTLGSQVPGHEIPAEQPGVISGRKQGEVAHRSR